MKFAMIVILASYGYLYLALCFYTVHVTGSTDGLADIGQSTVLAVTASALAVAAGAHQVARRNGHPTTTTGARAAPDHRALALVPGSGRVHQIAAAARSGASARSAGSAH